MRHHWSNYPAGKRLLADTGFAEDGSIDDGIPVVVEFLIDGYSAYFRSRGSHWSCTITKEDMEDTAPEEVLFKIDGLWGEWPAASHMPLGNALELVECVIAAFRATRAITPDFPKPLPKT